MKYFSLILLIFLFSCEKKKPFFVFDEVLHYSISLEESFKCFEKRNFNEKYNFLNNAMEIYSPETLNDTIFIQNLDKYFPKKNKIDKNKLAKLSDIFSETNVESKVETACEPIFRDVFVFKNNNSIVGISKICFSCMKEYTIGSRTSTTNFGSCNEYERLEKLVK